MSSMVKIFLFIILSIGGTSYLFFKIYRTPLVFALVPILSFLPIFMLFAMRKFEIDSMEIFLGEYMFYLNYILLGSVSLLIVALISKLFSLDLLGVIAERKKIFHISILIGMAVLSFYGKRNFENILTENYELMSTSLNSDKNLKFSFISDIHLNGEFDGRNLRTAFEKMKNEEVELVLIGGDFLDYSYKSIKDDIKSIIDEYQFKHGIYLVLGNHEYYGGVDENMEYIKGLGINILRDEKVEIEGITIVGRDDRHNKNRKSLEELLEGIDSEKTIIVVDHNPMDLKNLGDNKIDYYFSGHTHRGQIFPFNLIVDRMYENSRGYKKIGNTHTYVSSGLGTWMIPYRIGTQSEIFVFDIKI